MTFRVFDGVVLLEDLPEHGLARGERDAVVDVHTRPTEGCDTGPHSC